MRLPAIQKSGQKTVHDFTVSRTALKKKKYRKFIIKFGLLSVLTVQNAVHVIAMRYIRVRQQTMFLSTVAVFFAELIKLMICITLIVIDQRSIAKCLQLIRKQILQQPIDTLRVCVPALLYVVVGILMFTAISNLTAATFMISFQLKVLSAATFTVLLLHRRLSIMQWLSLPVLLAGIVLVQMDEKNNENSARKVVAQSDLRPYNSTTNAEVPVNASNVLRSLTNTDHDHISDQKPLVGFVAVIIICILSGFAGVYLEKILKDKKDVSLWIRNIQLCIVSLPVSFVSIFVKDRRTVLEQGFLVGFDTAVWLTILLAAFGGLIVAVIIKYTDNILKAFATSFAVILSCVFSAVIFHFKPTALFLIGALFVIIAVCVYSIFPYKSFKKPSVTAQSVALIEDEKQQL